MLCNLLTTILVPNFEEPLDTGKQLVEKNITLFFWPGAEGYIQFLMESPVPEYRILGEHAIIADDWDHYDNITAHGIMEAGTHAQLSYYMDWIGMEIGEEYHPDGRGWHRSTQTVPGIPPYAGHLTNKKWHLNEVLS